MRSPHLTRLRELLCYDPDTGVFTNRVFRRNCPVGREAGTLRKDGYRVITIDRVQYLAHRLAWFYQYGSLPDAIDHIDGDPTNNKICNLRPTTYSQNQHNRGATIINTSGAKGVTWDRNRSKWTVVIGFRGKSYNMGRFDVFDDAVMAAKGAREILHGEFHRHA